MSAPLLATKLYAPKLRPGHISRPRLAERLDAGLSRGLTLVAAAAGFGKTTLVAEWFGHLECPSTWLTLDEGDDDLVRFLAYFIAALQKVDGSLGQAAQSLLATPQPPPAESLMTLVINDVAATPEPFVLVLDDYDAIRAQTIHDAVEFLIEHQPPQARLVLITRQAPPLPVPRLRVRGRVVEIHERDLRFTADEAAELLRQALGIDLDSRLVAELEARTEGWIAGLQLASLSMAGKPPERVEEFVELFTGSHRHVIDYLADEVLAQQSDELRSFLCQTSILDRLSAPLCNAVAGRSDSEEVLRRLEQANLFLIPLDDDREWYRYHRLFADFLRTELDPHTQASLHTKAARWLEVHLLLPEAVKHALASGDLDLAARVVSRASVESLASGSLVTVQGWLDALPDEVIWGRADLLTLQGFLLFFAGRTTEAFPCAETAESSLPRDVTPSTRGRLLSLKAHLALCSDDLESTVALCREALACLDEKHAVFRNLTLNVLGQVLEARGDVLAAVDAYREVAHRTRHRGSEVGALVVLTNLVLGLNELGRLREAVAVCHRVIEDGPSHRGRGLPVAEGMYLAWSLLSYEADELTLARKQVMRALDLAEQAGIVDGILWGKFILARVLLASGELGEARQVAQEGREVAAAHDVYESKVQWFTALEAQAHLLEGNLAGAVRWADAAGFSPTDKPHHWDEFAYFQYVRILISQNRLDDARQLLDRMAESATQGQRRRKLISVFLLQAIVHQRAGRIAQAIARVAKAVELAAPEGYRRAFLDEGPAVLDLLPDVQHPPPAFLSQIFAAAGADGRDLPVPRGRALVEPLTDREQQILRLIAAGRTNPEIAELLYLSLNTVKWHVKNLYGKLGVGNRIEAVARAHESGLL